MTCADAEMPAVHSLEKPIDIRWLEIRFTSHVWHRTNPVELSPCQLAIDPPVYLKDRYLTNEERVTLARAVPADGAGATS